MYITSTTYKTQIRSGGHPWNITGSITFADASTLTLSNTDFMGPDYLTIKHGTSRPNTFDLGIASMRTISMTLNNYAAKFTGKNFFGAVIRFKVGITLDNATVFYIGNAGGTGIDYGIFTVDRPVEVGSTITVTAVDNMYKFEKLFTSSAVGATALDWSAPITIEDLLTYLCDAVNVTLIAPTVWINEAAVVRYEPNTTNLTYRDVLSMICQITCTYAYIDSAGALNLSWYSATYTTPYYLNAALYTTVPSILYSLKVNKDACLITGIEYRTNDTPVLHGTDAGTVIVIENNLLLDPVNSVGVLDNLFASLNNYTFRPFNCDAIVDFSVECGDPVTVVDIAGNTYNTILTNYTHVLRGRSSYSGDGQTTMVSQTNAYDPIARIKAIANNQAEDVLTGYEEMVLDTSVDFNTSSGYYETWEVAAGLQHTYDKYVDGPMLGYYQHDQPEIADSTYITKVTAGYIGFANTKIAGVPQYTTIVTAGTITVEHLATRLIIADLIKVGRISALNGVSFLDLDNGQFNFGKDANNYVKFDGTNFDIKGKVTITSGSGFTKTFMAEPTTPYNIGDLWITSVTDTLGDLKKCVVQRLTGAYTAADWVVALSLIETAKLGTTIVEGGYIKTGLVSATNINTGTLAAARIAASSLTADKIATTSPNLLYDLDSFEQYLTVDLSGSSDLSTCIGSIEEAYHGRVSLKTINNAANSYAYLCQGGAVGWIKLAVGKYLLSGYVKTTTATASVVLIPVLRQGATGTALTVGGTVTTGNNAALLATDGWIRLTAAVVITDLSQNPYFTFFVRTQTATPCTVYWDAFQLEFIGARTDVIPSEFGIGGSVTINGGNILADTITADMITIDATSTFEVGYDPITKSKVFAQDAIPTSISVGDLWFDTNDGNKCYRATAVGDTTIAAGHWVLYQDLNKTTTFAQDGIPVSTAIGDMWIDTNDTNKLYRAASIGADAVTAGEWILVRDSGIATAIQAAADAQADATTALTYTNNLANDSVITPDEKLTLKPIFDQIASEALGVITNLAINGGPTTDTASWVHFSTYSTESLVAGWLRSTRNTNRPYFGQTANFSSNSGTKIYYRFMARGNKAGNISVWLMKTGSAFGVAEAGHTAAFPITTTATEYSGIITSTDVASGFAIDCSSFTTAGDYVEVQFVVIQDFVAEFGASLVPTAAQMTTWLANVTNSWFEGSYIISKIERQADSFGVSHVVFTNAWGALYTYLQSTLALFADLTIAKTGIVRTTWDLKWNDYYSARTDLLIAIATKAKALADAAQAKADRQRTTYMAEPTTPYYVGDLWITSTTATLGDLKKCVVERLTGAYTAADWVVALALIEVAKLGTTVIEGGYIKTGLVSATNIDVGTLAAARIAAQSLTADKIATTSPNLLYDNDSFEQYLGKDIGGTGLLSTHIGSSEEAYHGRVSFKTINSAANSYAYLNAGYFKLAIGKYILSAYVKTTTATASVILFPVLRQGATSTTLTVGGTASAGSNTALLATDGWIRLTAVVVITALTQNPYFEFYVRTQTATPCTVYWDAFQLEFIGARTDVIPAPFAPGGSVSINGGNIQSDGTIQLFQGGTGVAGLTGQTSGETATRIWAGSTFANRDTAPYRTLQDGTTIYSSVVSGIDVVLTLSPTGSISITADDVPVFGVTSAGRIFATSLANKDSSTDYALVDVPNVGYVTLQFYNDVSGANPPSSVIGMSVGSAVNILCIFDNVGKLLMSIGSHEADSIIWQLKHRSDPWGQASVITETGLYFIKTLSGNPIIYSLPGANPYIELSPPDDTTKHIGVNNTGPYYKVGAVTSYLKDGATKEIRTGTSTTHATPGTAKTITFATGMTGTPSAVIVTPTSGYIVYVTAKTSTTFDVKSTGATTGFDYIAIY